jgi:ribosomal protein S18 acetylase RimI-like enzyme
MFLADLAEELRLGPQQWQHRCEATYWSSARVGDAHVGLAGVIEYPNEDPRHHVEGMWVDPAYRNAGIGRRLLADVESHVRGIGHQRVGLWVVDGNDRALALYRSQGFRRTARPRGLLPGGRVEREYAKQLG